MVFQKELYNYIPNVTLWASVTTKKFALEGIQTIHRSAP
jgi:hypothetical protein